MEKPLRQRTLFDEDGPVESSIVLSVEEGRGILRSFFESFGISGIDVNQIQLREDQLAILQALLGVDSNRPERLALEAGTGIGKTFLFIVESLKVIGEGRQAILASPQLTLVDQAFDSFKRFTAIGNGSVVKLSGRIAPKKRKAVYAARPQVILVTKNTLANDIKELDLSTVGLVYIDESQFMQGCDPGVALLQRLKAESCGRSGGDNPLLLRVMSGTLAGNEQKLLDLLAGLQPTSVITVPTKGERLQRVDRVEAGQAQGSTPELFQIEMDPQIRALSNELRLQAIRLESEIDAHFSVPTLFRMQPEAPDYRVPSFLEREALLKKIQGIKTKNFECYCKLVSFWAELNRFCNLFNRLVLLGRFSFLEGYFYLYSKQVLFDKLYLSEIEGEVPVKDRYRLRQADKRVVGNEAVRQCVVEVVKDTPYALLLELTDWADISNHNFSRFGLATLDAQTYSSQARGELVRQANRSLGRNQALNDYERSLTAWARSFFDDALTFMARRELPDSAKLGMCSELLNRHREDIISSRSFIFTAQTRHSDFLAEWLEWRSADSGFKPVSVHGRSGPGMRQYQEMALSGFRNGDYNILCTTVPFGGTGIDVPEAKIAVFYCLPDSNAVNLQQAMGRVYGRAEHPYVYVIATKGTLEVIRLPSALAKGQRRRAAVVRRARMVG